MGKIKKKINILALGDVGGTLLLGLKMLGKNSVSEIGIFDENKEKLLRYEAEINQIREPFEKMEMPKVKILNKSELFDCDIFVFCATAGVPPVGTEEKDIRMYQLEKNSNIVTEYAVLARKEKYKGIFAILSDPVEVLCKVAFLESNKNAEKKHDAKGLAPSQIKGYGLGVMHGRAVYFSEKDERYKEYKTEGRCYGAHGVGIIVANSIKKYDHKRSVELTKLVEEANLKVREYGFKPYIAPAISSGAIAIIQTLEGKWHYSSNLIGEVYFGAKNKISAKGIEFEKVKMEDKLFNRILDTYKYLREIL